MPDALEHPRFLRAVVPLMGRERFAGLRRDIVDELVAFAHRPALRSGGRLAGEGGRLLPGLAAVIGALNDLPEPAAGLRGIDAIRIDGGALHVIDLPAAEHGAGE